MTNQPGAVNKTQVERNTDLSLMLDEVPEGLTLPEAVSICPRCQSVNPAEANYCHFDQEPLRPNLPRASLAPTAARGLDETFVGGPNQPLPVRVLDTPGEGWPAGGGGNAPPPLPWAGGPRFAEPVPPGSEANNPLPVVVIDTPGGGSGPNRTWPGATNLYGPDPLAELRNVCQGAVKDWAQIDYLANEARQAGHSLPPDLAQFEDEARRRWNCYELLHQALEKNSLPETVAAYDPALLDDWPACSELVVRAREARACWDMLCELRAQVKKPGSGQTLLTLWSRCAPALAAWPEETESIRRAVLDLEARNRAWSNLKHLLQQPVPSERGIAQAWELLRKAGGHPDAATVQERARLAGLRAACLARLPAADAPLSEETDARVLQGWDETLLKDCPEAAAQRHRFEQARQRLERVDEVEKVIAKVDQGLAKEKEILDRAAKLPQGYAHRHQARVAVAAKRAHLLQKLDAALEAANPSDKEIAALWEQLRQAGAAPGPKKMKRVDLAVQRLELLDQFEHLDPRLPLDQQDRHWVKNWDAPLFQSCADADPFRPRYQKAIQRIKTWNALARAIKAKDLSQVVLWAGNPLLANYPPLERIKGEVNDLLRQANQLQRAEGILQKDDPALAINQLDLDFIRAHPDLFAPHRQSIEVLLTRWLTQDQRIAAAQPGHTRNPGTGRLVVRWTWQNFKLISCCKVAVSGECFFKTEEEAGGQTMRWDVEAHRRVGGGMVAPPLPGKSRLFVTVWPLIDLGWTELAGPPLHLGPFRTNA